mmetsp:Transcript_78801/g.142141  ORF Transcript_78801/g.142141 Transcript_78801/m.142141 type:complete len:152 (-) Transcript_78801:546-1001(-)
MAQATAKVNRRWGLSLTFATHTVCPALAVHCEALCQTLCLRTVAVAVTNPSHANSVEDRSKKPWIHRVGYAIYTVAWSILEHARCNFHVGSSYWFKRKPGCAEFVLLGATKVQDSGGGSEAPRRPLLGGGSSFATHSQMGSSAPSALTPSL